MGEILISFDYGRRAEYLTSFVLSPYAITVPVRGHDDRVESDFLCIGFEEKEKSFLPNLKLIFWVQTKSQSSQKPHKITIGSKSKVDSILDNKMPYFVAIVNTKESPTVSLYGTSERVAFRHMHPYEVVEKIDFIPGMPKDQKMYRFVESNRHAEIHMGKPFLKFTTLDNYKRIDDHWKILKNKIEKEYRNFLYASVGLGTYERDPLPWAAIGEQEKIFYPKSGQLTKETLKSILIALQMLDLTIIEKERTRNPNSKLAKAMEIIFKSFKQNKA
ncbi:MAG: hypothetical protein L6247_00135 [Desulfobacteraceae bacterium]|nr:hypothetical protein [Pseudomonadota bacterium]MCG2753975.1 hypothetical protein [Desulfobacteraceae bacterium]